MKLRGLILAAALLAAPAAAAAQDAETVLADLDRFRSALGANRAMNAWFDDGAPEPIVVSAEAGQIRLRDREGRAVSVGANSADASLPLRLLAAVLSTGGLATALAGSGFEVGEQLLGFEVFDALDGPVLTRRVGTAAASMLVEPGTSRPRQLRVLHEGSRWQVDLVSYDGSGAGWLPSEIVIRADDRVVLVVRFVDAAREETSLAPMSSWAAGPSAPVLRFPRLPL